MFAPEVRDRAEKICCGCVLDSDMSGDNSFSCIPRRVGNSILLCGRRRSVFPFQCLVGPDWMLVILVYVLIISANVAILYIAHPLGWPPILIGGIGAMVLLGSYSATVCSDPGIVFKNDCPLLQTELTQRDVEDPLHLPEPAQEVRMASTGDAGARNDPANPANPATSIECGQCQFQRPPTARHCTHCGVCIDELDHHCPWSGKCIGKRNLKAFYLFLHTLCFQFYYLAGLLIYYLIFAVGNSSAPHGPSF